MQRLVTRGQKLNNTYYLWTLLPNQVPMQLPLNVNIVEGKRYGLELTESLEFKPYLMLSFIKMILNFYIKYDYIEHTLNFYLVQPFSHSFKILSHQVLEGLNAITRWRHEAPGICLPHQMLNKQGDPPAPLKQIGRLDLLTKEEEATVPWQHLIKAFIDSQLENSSDTSQSFLMNDLPLRLPITTHFSLSGMNIPNNEELTLHQSAI